MDVQVSDGIAELTISREQYNFIVGAVQEVTHEIEDWEYPTRTGFEKDEARELLRRMEEANRRSSSDDEVALTVTEDEVIIITGSLREVLEELRGEAFQRRLGLGRAEADQLRKELKDLSYDAWRKIEE